MQGAVRGEYLAYFQGLQRRSGAAGSLPKGLRHAACARPVAALRPLAMGGAIPCGTRLATGRVAHAEVKLFVRQHTSKPLVRILGIRHQKPVILSAIARILFHPFQPFEQ